MFGQTTGGLFGAKPASSATPAATGTTTTSHNLGGLDVSVNNKGLTQGSTNPTAAKENLLPNEIMQTIDSFKYDNFFHFILPHESFEVNDFNF